jgi:hypothetical protein
VTQIQITMTEPGVNMGDHAQDVVTAVEAKPDETVADLVERLLTKMTYRSARIPTPAVGGADEDFIHGPRGFQRAPDPTRYLTIRLAADPDDQGDL